MFSATKSRPRNGGTPLLPETKKEWAGYIFAILFILTGFEVSWYALLGLHDPALKWFQAHTTLQYFTGFGLLFAGVAIALITGRHHARRTKLSEEKKPEDKNSS